MNVAQFTKVASFITPTVGGKGDSTGRRNTFVYILFEQLVESFGGSSPAEGFGALCSGHGRQRSALQCHDD